MNCPECTLRAAVRAGIQVRSNLPEHRPRGPLFLHGSCGSLARMDEKHVRPALMRYLPFKAVMLPGNWGPFPTGAMRGELPAVPADRKKPALSTVSSTCGHLCLPGLTLEINHRQPCL